MPSDIADSMQAIKQLGDEKRAFLIRGCCCHVNLIVDSLRLYHFKGSDFSRDHADLGISVYTRLASSEQRSGISLEREPWIYF